MLLASLALLVLSIPAFLQVPGLATSVQAVGESMTFLRISAARARVIFPIVTTLLSISLAVLIYWRKPAEPMAVFFSFYLLAYALTMTGPLEAVVAYWLPEQPDLAIALQAIYFPIFNVILLLIFPNGRFQPRWTRILVAAVTFLSMGAMFIDINELVRPTNLITALFLLAFYSILLLAFIFQVYRYRSVYTYAERQQTKWAVFGTIIWFVFIAISSIPYYYLLYLPPGAPPPEWQSLVSALWFLGLSILPLGFGIAILRSRLWEIDLIIRRTLVYTILTVMLALVYFGLVILLEGVLRSLVGSSGQVATVISTLTIAALFTPLRHRVQDVIDRRFYRQKYDAQRALASFAETARNETDLGVLSAQLQTLAEEALQPEHISLWINTPAKIGRNLEYELES